jgi:putative ABC transport system permease protein
MVRTAVVSIVLVAMTLTAAATPDHASAAGQAPPDVLISRQLAEAFGIAAGAIVRFSTDPSGGNPREFRVAGIYEPVPDPMRINASKHEVRLHLPDLLEMTADPADPLSGQAVDAINISLARPDEARAFARQVAARIPGVSARAVQGLSGEAATFVVLERFHLAIAIVTIVASTVFLLALTVMLVDERRETVGILRLIGLTTRRILVQVFVEGLLIAVAGALLGLGLGIASEGLINSYFQWHYDTALVFVRITPDVALRCVAVAVPLGALASVAASWALLRRSVLRLARR